MGGAIDAGTGGPAGRVLVVDDDRVTALVLMRILRERGGFEVSHAPDGESALAQAGTGSWDLVLTDVEMPGMSGIDLLAALRKADPDLPVAVITAYPSVDYAVQALRGQADEFLEKPVAPAQLVTVATALVAQGRAAREAGRVSVLAIGAHPDDVEIGAAGTLLAHRERGATVTVLTLSRGARGGSQEARAAESLRAANVLGAGLHLEDLQDTHISEADPTIRAISEVVREVRPSVVYTHSVHDVHQDHRNTHRAAMVAVREVGRVYCFQSPSATVEFRPNRFVSIDEQIIRKLAAIEAYSSQVCIRPYLDPDLIQSTARYWSRYADGRYAEPFEVIREAAEVGERPAGRGATAGPAAQPPIAAGGAG